MEIFDVCIIGAGASGLAAASSLENGISVCILEKNGIPGRKLAATGGGRCNITNTACNKVKLTLDFFNGLGLELYHDDEGRYYPYSNRASDVVTVLMRAVKQRNTSMLFNFDVSSVLYRNGIFEVSNGSKTVRSVKLIIASGGKAAPAMGTTGDGYKFARKLGHETSRLYPVLTGIECGDFSELKGIRAHGTVRLYKDGMLVKAETGEIQFTEDGISGICVFNLSLHIRAEEGEKFEASLGRYSLFLDLAPDFTEEYISSRKESFGILCERLAEKVDIKNIKSWELPVVGVKGWKYAQCTGGGILKRDINMATMESMIVPGLYFTGEIVDGCEPCGGFNLQNAWETGIKAAKAINAALER